VKIVKGPYLQWPTTHSAIVMWETDRPATGAVTWYRTERVHSGLSGQPRTAETSSRVAAGAPECRVHRVEIDGLEPSRVYHYEVAAEAGSERVGSERHLLRAAPAPGTPFTFAVTSETGGYGDDEVNRSLFAQLAAHRPDILLVVGDAVAKGSQYDDWERWFFGPGREFLHSTPFYLCPGNHEEAHLTATGGPYGPPGSWLREFTSYPDPGTYYGFEYGDAHFTALDSTAMVEYADGRPRATTELEDGSAQLEFLSRDLDRAGVAWRLAFYHYPPYVSGDYEVPQMRRLAPLLEAGGVDVVLNSHTIVYERSHPLRGDALDENGGIVYVVAGGAGAKPDWFHRHRAWHTAHAQAVPHFLLVTVTPQRLDLRAIDVQGRLFDRLELRR